MHTYAQKTGNWRHDGVFWDTGYSGVAAGLNNTAMQDVHSIGPIPQGVYIISGPPYDSPSHGPYVMRLLPAPETDTYGRSGFLIHGDRVDAAQHPFMASEGCIILPRPIREQIWNSDDRTLTVIPDDDETPPVC